MQTLPMQLYTVAEIRAIEHAAHQDYQLSATELMYRAGVQALNCIQRHFSQAQQLLIICGSGNNAGDGYVLARLAMLAGVDVNIYTVIDPKQLSDAAQQAYQHYMDINGRLTRFTKALPMYADVIVDALLGTGLSRDVDDEYRVAIEQINASQCPVLALDIPSGLQANTGRVLGCAVHAQLTMTFIGLKQGLYTGQAKAVCGEIILATLDIPDELLTSNASTTACLQRIVLPPRVAYAHKGHFGHILIIGGDLGYSGAVKLAAEAALRVGAGLVSVATRTEHALFLNAHRPELMCHGIATPAQLHALLARVDVVVLGPGLGQADWGQWVFAEAIQCTKPMIIDADGLNLLARQALHKATWILTPHPGEAARLLNVSIQTIEQDRFHAAKQLVAERGGTIVLKGSGTLIATAHALKVATQGNPGMASGGMGDVLAGVIAGLVGQGLSLSDAAQQGVWLHATAADSAAQQGGERGLLASDVFPWLRQWVNQ